MTRAGRRHTAVYRRLIRALLPGSLQLEAERELVETFESAHDRIAHRSLPVRAVFWIGILFDLIATSLGERVARRGGWLLDFRYVLRGLAASRGYTAIAILSLAIGIGANSAVFSVIRVLLLDRMAVRAPEELSILYWHQPGSFRMNSRNSGGFTDETTGLRYASNVTYPIYSSIRAASPQGVNLSGFNFIRDVAIQYGDMPATTTGGMLADGAFFEVVAPRMAAGRALGPEDAVEGAEPAAVLSHRLWMRVFGGDREIVGKVIRVNRVPTIVAGITAADFRGLSKGGFFPPADITLPLRLAPRYQPQWVPREGSLFSAENLFWLRMIARVPDSVPKETVAARLASPITPHIAPMLTGSGGKTATVALVDASRGIDQTNADTRKLLYVLMGVVLAVLGIACANLATLMLARGAARQRELSVRRALGAGRGRLIRVLVLEAMVLAIAGGLGGLILTWWSRAALTTILTAGLGTAPMSVQPMEVDIDVRLVAVTFALSLTAAIVFSLLPALRLSRDRGVDDLRQQVVGARSPRLTIGRLLVSLQIAVTVPLVVGAILFLRTVSKLGDVDLGFEPAGLVLFKVDPAQAVPADRHARLYLDLLERIRAIPGVVSATLMENAFLSGVSSNTSAEIDGTPQRVRMNAVGPGFLETMGLRLLAGRLPGVQDGAGGPHVAAINETAARQFFPGQSPLGKVLKTPSRTIVIVGVVSDTLYESQRRGPQPTMFDSVLQRTGSSDHVVVRTTLRPGQIEPDLKRAVLDVHRDLPVPAIRSQIEQIRIATMRERVFAQTLSIFGAFTLLLASIGLHGVTSYSVRRRTNEIGLRMALGARRSDVVWMIQRHVLVLAALGVAAGVPLALWVAPLVGTLLFGVSPGDTVVILTAAAIMFATAAVSGLLPARRAAGMDPLEALRAE